MFSHEELIGFLSDKMAPIDVKVACSHKERDTTCNMFN
jgi:hypothetical protein